MKCLLFFLKQLAYGVMPLDIIVTIPKSEYENDDRETYVYEQSRYEQFWQLSSRPKRLNIGDKVTS